MSVIRSTIVVAALGAALAMGLLAVPAAAATSMATLTAPPVPLLAPTPVEACIGSECEETPNLATVSMVVTASFVKGGLMPPPPPMILPVACPEEEAEGTALAVIATARGKLNISANLIGTLSNGMPYFETLAPKVVRSKGLAAVLVTACTDDGDDGRLQKEKKRQKKLARRG